MNKYVFVIENIKDKTIKTYSTLKFACEIEGISFKAIEHKRGAKGSYPVEWNQFRVWKNEVIKKEM